MRRDLDNARWLADQVDAAPDWRVLAPVTLQTVCIRHEPPRLTADALDRHTLAWADRINRSGRAYLTPALLDDRWMVRVSIGAEQTEREHVAACGIGCETKPSREPKLPQVPYGCRADGCS